MTQRSKKYVYIYPADRPKHTLIYSGRKKSVGQALPILLQGKIGYERPPRGLKCGAGFKKCQRRGHRLGRRQRGNNNRRADVRKHVIGVETVGWDVQVLQLLLLEALVVLPSRERVLK